MRFLMSLKMPLEPFNSYVKDGSIGARMGKILGELKPEAAYFTAMTGHRGGILVVHMDNPSQIPAFAEPWFLQFNANVEFQAAMSAEDLAKAGLEGLGKQWG